ncbi:MAG TPA: hypothetical protein VHK01_12490 [Lacipirellulaceae bacterium]|nr:hypothetical protein [Lacipirellulaceae bacterium]
MLTLEIFATKPMSPDKLLMLIVVSVAISGCGGSASPFESVPVSGKVTYEDGSPIPLPAMTIFFHSMEPPVNGMYPRPARVGVGPDGTFKDVTTYKYADGLVLGKHKVSLVAEKGGKLANQIPREYALPDKTPLVVEVTESGQFLEIKVPKPRSTPRS